MVLMMHHPHPHQPWRLEYIHYGQGNAVVVECSTGLPYYAAPPSLVVLWVMYCLAVPQCPTRIPSSHEQVNLLHCRLCGTSGM